MNFHKKLNYKDKVVKCAEDILDRTGSVNLLDVLNNMSWLDVRHIYEWKDGLADSLEKYMQSAPEKRQEVYTIFQKWAANYQFIEAPWLY